jgi:predicted membrane-bound dolichyl-phosphate-mannose-protein mannosyltransferase
MPCTPIPFRASLTSSSLNGLMTASIFFIGDDLLSIFKAILMLELEESFFSGLVDEIVDGND